MLLTALACSSKAARRCRGSRPQSSSSPAPPSSPPSWSYPSSQQSPSSESSSDHLRRVGVAVGGPSGPPAASRGACTSLQLVPPSTRTLRGCTSSYPSASTTVLGLLHTDFPSLFPCGSCGESPVVAAAAPLVPWSPFAPLPHPALPSVAAAPGPLPLHAGAREDPFPPPLGPESPCVADPRPPSSGRLPPAPTGPLYPQRPSPGAPAGLPFCPAPLPPQRWAPPSFPTSAASRARPQRKQNSRLGRLVSKPQWQRHSPSLCRDPDAWRPPLLPPALPVRWPCPRSASAPSKSDSNSCRAACAPWAPPGPLPLLSPLPRPPRRYIPPNGAE